MSSVSSPAIFLLGATGYIGGTILTSLLKSYPTSKITVQYRQDAHKAILEAFSSNIIPVKATLQDTTILAAEAAKADLVVNCADCDDQASVQALIDGLESAASTRTEKGQHKAVYIHTSGTGELTDLDVPLGHEDKTVYDDADLAQITAMPESRIHRKVTNNVARAFERGNFLGYIILPSAIYGRGTGPINQASIQIPAVINYALDHGRATYVDPGLNYWSHVHIDALAILYTSLISLLFSPSSAPPLPKSGLEHYVFATASEGPHSWKELAERVGDALFELGAVKEGGAVGGEGEKWSGTNSVGLSTRAKQLVGWTDEHHLWDYIKGDCEDAYNKWKSGEKVAQVWKGRAAS